jgi:hypothetical protein
MDTEQIFRQLCAIDQLLTAASGNLYGVDIPDSMRHSIAMLDTAASMTGKLASAMAREFNLDPHWRPHNYY